MFVYDILPADAKAIAGGLIVDIGTTTVSALLVDMLTGEILAKASAGNGQIRYGADVINRIIESAKPGGQKRLQDAIVKETLNPMIRQMCASAGFSGQHIYRMAVAGNTTMEHLLMGINADPLRMEPYIPTFSRQILSMRRISESLFIRTHILSWLRISEAMWAAISPPVRWSV